MKVGLLGRNGMLGSMVKLLLDGEKEFDVVSSDRKELSIFPRKLNDIGPLLTKHFGADVDYMINCIGAIKPTFKEATNPTVPIYTNAVFPHQLAQWANLTDTKLIHITTDCVYDGVTGRYDEESPHTALDDYGKSKSLGEPENAMVLRTSIIGPEIGGRQRSFLEWIKSQNGKTINGYVNHMWNGITTLELAHTIMDILDSDLYDDGTYHVFSEDVSKYDLCKAVVEAYGLDIRVEPTMAEKSVNRTLRSIHDFNDYIQPSELDKMLNDLVVLEEALGGR